MFLYPPPPLPVYRCLRYDGRINLKYPLIRDVLGK